MIIDKISKMDRYAYIPGVQKAVDFFDEFAYDIRARSGCA